MAPTAALVLISAYFILESYIYDVTLAPSAALVSIPCYLRKADYMRTQLRSYGSSGVDFSLLSSQRIILKKNSVAPAATLALIPYYFMLTNCMKKSAWLLW